MVIIVYTPNFNFMINDASESYYSSNSSSMMSCIQMNKLNLDASQEPEQFRLTKEFDKIAEQYKVAVENYIELSQKNINKKHADKKHAADQLAAERLSLLSFAISYESYKLRANEVTLFYEGWAPFRDNRMI